MVSHKLPALNTILISFFCYHYYVYIDVILNKMGLVELEEYMKLQVVNDSKASFLQ